MKKDRKPSSQCAHFSIGQYTQAEVHSTQVSTDVRKDGGQVAERSVPTARGRAWEERTATMERGERRLQGSKTGTGVVLAEGGHRDAFIRRRGAAVVRRAGPFSRKEFTRRCCTYQKMESLCADR